jgi:hypothetical protein
MVHMSPGSAHGVIVMQHASPCRPHGGGTSASIRSGCTSWTSTTVTSMSVPISVGTDAVGQLNPQPVSASETRNVVIFHDKPV